MGKPFEKVHVCTVGKFEDGDKIPQWLRANGGTYCKVVSKRVTHLIATEKAYEENTEAVQKAKELGTIKIVSFDWLEDSLLSRTKRPKPEEPYLWRTLLKEEDEKPKAQKRIKDPFKESKVTKNTKKAKAATLPKRQIYTDPQTGETWDATLVRACAPPHPREKYRLGIFETTGNPHSYSAFARYSRVGVSHVEQLSPPKLDSAIAIKAFKAFFKQQTGKSWEDRADGKVPPPKTGKDGHQLPAHEGWYSNEITTNMFTDWIKSKPYQPSAPVKSASAANGPMESDAVPQTKGQT